MTLIETFPIHLPGYLTGYLYRPNHRPSGRRIIVRDAASMVVYDTEDCYDVGNAAAMLAEWCDQQECKAGAA